MATVMLCVLVVLVYCTSNHVLCVNPMRAWIGGSDLPKDLAPGVRSSSSVDFTGPAPCSITDHFIQ